MLTKAILLTGLMFTVLLHSEAQGINPTYPDVHDPVMAKGDDGRFYVFSTGMGVSVMSSSDMKTWKKEKDVFTFVPKDVAQEEDRGRRRPPEADWTKSTIPHWAVDSVRGYWGHTWAPDIINHNGKWYLYYSCSTFGKNRSAIGVAINKTLDTSSPDYKWVDEGPVIVSHQHKDNYNAIDPNLIIDKETGAPYLTFGSFWDGIQLMRLGDDMKTPVSEPTTIARRIGRKLSLAEIDNVANFTIEGGDTIEAGENAIEAPFITYRDGWYYLFVSWDYCCRGRNSTYKTIYGRSRTIDGPYLDKEGRDMAHGGGNLLVGPCEEFFGIGHCSVYEFDGKWYFLSHAYDVKENGRAKIFLRELLFDKAGWPYILQ